MPNWKKWVAPHRFDSSRHRVELAFKAKLVKGQGIFAHVPIGYRRGSEGRVYAWTIAQVKNILGDETYTKDSIHYRETSISYRNKKRIRRGPSGWVCVEGTHEVIISRDIPDHMRKQVVTRHHSMKDQATQTFSRPPKCAGCS